MKKLILMLMIGGLVAQNNPKASTNEIENPCEDKIFLELNEKKLDEMTDKEYDYFSQKSTECTRYHNTIITMQPSSFSIYSFSSDNYKKLIPSFKYFKFRNLNKIKFGQNFTTNNQDEKMLEYARRNIFKTYFIKEEKKHLLCQEYLASMNTSMKIIMHSLKIASFTYKLVK